MEKKMGRFIVREYYIDSPKLNKDVTAVLLADLHNCVYGIENQKLLECIDRIDPDLILSAGDMLTARPGNSVLVAQSLMTTLAGKYPVFYALGNHEYRMKIYCEDYHDLYDQYMNEIIKSGIRVLDNESIELPELSMKITGLSIERQYYKRFRKIKMEQSYLRREIGTSSTSYFQLLLAHNPEYYDEYDEWGADLVLSGHVHGGVMRLPFLGGVISPKLVLFPKYDGGQFAGKNGNMVLSRGLGSHTIPLRIFNPPELVVLHLAKKQESL